MFKKNFFVGCFVTVIVGCSQDTGVIAQVGKDKITQGEFDSYLKHKRIPKQNSEQVSAQLNEFLEREAMAQAIKQSNVLDKSLIKAEIREFEKQALISRYFEQFLNDNVSDQALRNYYTANQDDYASKQVHIAHLLVRTNSNAPESDKQVRLTLANEAYSLINRGKRFEDVVLSHSDDTRTSKKGGDLGWVNEGAVSPEFSNAAFSLPVGSVSKPIESQMGYHIIKVIEEPKIVNTSFDAVKGKIRYQLRMDAKKAEIERLLESVKVSTK